MKKVIKIICVIAVIAIIAAIVVFFVKSNKTVQESNFGEIKSSEALYAIIDMVYENIAVELPMLQTQILDVTDAETITYMTGIANSENIEFAVVSEPMMSSQAYSFVLVKVKEGIDADQLAKEMCDNIDNRKWICVTADKVYATSSGDLVCLVMSREEVAKPVYEKFKALTGPIGQEYERTEEQAEIPVEDQLGEPIEEQPDMPASTY